MKKLIIPVIFLVVSIFGCQSEKKKAVKTDIGFSKYVNAYTDGTISRESVIEVYLKQPLSGISAAAPVLFDVFSVLKTSEWFEVPYDELTEIEICAQVVTGPEHNAIQL